MKRILIRSSAPPVVEIDPASWSAYVRFKKQATVAKTVPLETSSLVVTVDLDENSQVIGVELVGVKEFSVSTIVRLIAKLPVKAPRIDWNRARFVPAGAPALAEA